MLISTSVVLLAGSATALASDEHLPVFARVPIDSSIAREAPRLARMRAGEAIAVERAPVLCASQTSIDAVFDVEESSPDVLSWPLIVQRSRTYLNYDCVTRRQFENPLDVTIDLNPYFGERELVEVWRQFESDRGRKVLFDGHQVDLVLSASGEAEMASLDVWVDFTGASTWRDFLHRAGDAMYAQNGSKLYWKAAPSNLSDRYRIRVSAISSAEVRAQQALRLERAVETERRESNGLDSEPTPGEQHTVPPPELEESAPSAVPDPP